MAKPDDTDTNPSEFFKRCDLGDGGYTAGPARNSKDLVKAVLRKEKDTRTNSELAAALAQQHPARYQASVEHPGLIELVSEDGTVRVGRWIGGRFVESSRI